MDQATHAWIAVRAVALLEDCGGSAGVVQLLKPNALGAAIGAWIPDLQDAKRGGSKVENHVLKMEPYKGSQAERFTADKGETLKRLGPSRRMEQYLRQDSTLDAKWWSLAYKGDVSKPGQHLANRAMALSTTMADLLLLGNEKVDKLLPGDVKFACKIKQAARTTEQQAALHFFMLSHFIADACMPCHCDGRALASYGDGKSLHAQLEKHWSGLVGKVFAKPELLKKGTVGGVASVKASEDLVQEARKVDDSFKPQFTGGIPALIAGDVWLEIVNVCRGSFAVSSIMAPVAKYPHGGTSVPTLDQVLPATMKAEQERIDAVVMHDAVLNVAMVWQHIWNQVTVK